MIEPESFVLVIDDEAPIRRFLKTFLESQGYGVLEAETGRRGLNLAAGHSPALILLDLGLPDMDGLEVLTRLKEWSNRPVIVLSARHQETDKIAALDSGAVDYLTKPFGVGELAARIRVALRLTKGEAEAEAVIECGDLRIDLANREVSAGGRSIRLTPIEFKLLAYLAKNAGKVVTHNQILREVWGPASGEQAHYARIYVRQLRLKLEPDPARPKYLRTETGVGYRLLSSQDQ